MTNQEPSGRFEGSLAPRAGDAGIETVGGSPVSSLGKRLGGYFLEVVLMIVTLVIGWFIWSLVAWGKGRTPAKQILKMQVVKVADGQVAGWGTMALREFVVKSIPGAILAFAVDQRLGSVWTIVAGLFIFGGALHQTLWDRIVGTTVVDAR